MARPPAGQGIIRGGMKQHEVVLCARGVDAVGGRAVGGRAVGLSLAKLGAGHERYYLDAVSSGREDGGAGELPGRWLGRGAADLGLSGRVRADELSGVMAGAEPRSGESLRPARHPVRVAGLDLTFAAPKSASVVLALAGEPVGAEVRAGHDAAVSAAAGYLERCALWARRGSGPERREVPVSGLVGAAFVHRTSRAADPHLHTHLLVANLVSDGHRWSAIDARGLFAHCRTAGFLYEAHLRTELGRRLGVGWTPVRRGRAEILGIYPPVLRAFCRRHAEVTAWLSARGASGPQAERVAVVATRLAKDPTLGFEELRGSFAERASAAGLGPGQLASALGGQGARAVPPIDAERLAAAIVTRDDLVRASFARADILRAWCEALPEGATVPQVEQLADQLLASRLVARSDARGSLHGSGLAGGRGPDGRMTFAAGGPRWTTPAALEARRAVEAAVRQLPGTEARPPSPLGPTFGSAGLVAGGEAALAGRPLMAGGQSEAVRRLVASREAVEVVTGRPARGCLDALDAAREAWEGAGLTVTGVAATPEGAVEMEWATGIRTTTVSCLPADVGRLGDVGAVGDVVVASGAHAMGAGELVAILDRARASRPGPRSDGEGYGGPDRHGVKVVLVGECRQGMDGTFADLCRRRGAAVLDLDAGRQALAPSLPAPTERTAGTEHGADLVSVRPGAERDRVVFATSREQAREAVVADWWEWRGIQEALMVAPRRREVDALNAAARATLSAAGHLGPVVLRGPFELRVGDEVLVREAGARGAQRAPRAATVTGLRDDGEVSLLAADGAGLAVEPSSAPARLRYGYAATPAVASGLGPRPVLVLGSGPAPRSSPAPQSEPGWRPACDRYVVVGEAPPAPRLGELDERRAALLGQGRVPPLARAAELDRTLERRAEALVKAAEVTQPDHLRSELGPLPIDAAGRSVWRRAAARVQSYRERWDLGSERRCLDREPAVPPRRMVERMEASRAVTTARRRLAPELAREKGLGRDLGRGIA